MRWVQSQSQFSPAAKAEFAAVSDGWLIAYAKAKEAIVVTHEVLAPMVQRKVPIPNICKAFSIEYINTFEMLRRLKFQFTG